MRRIAPFLVCLVLCSATAAFGQDYTLGMNTRVLTARMADKMVELGAGVVRVPYGWDLIDPICKGCFNWTTTDGWRDEARRTRRVIYGSLAFAPAWANGGHPYYYPPLNYQDWYDFVYAVVSRYRNDIHLWGIWNEPNLDPFLKGADLKVYRSLVISARAAILAANPSAAVLGPDVSHHALQDGWFGAAMTDFGDLFDIVTVHWYADGPEFEYAMDHLVRPFSLAKPVWLSEAGLTACTSLFGEVGQALLYQRVLSPRVPALSGVHRGSSRRSSSRVFLNPQPPSNVSRFDHEVMPETPPAAGMCGNAQAIRWACAVALVVAAHWAVLLTRETTAIFAVAVLADTRSSTPDRARSRWSLAVPLVALITWQALLTYVWGRVPLFSGCVGIRREL